MHDVDQYDWLVYGIRSHLREITQEPYCTINKSPDYPSDVLLVGVNHSSSSDLGPVLKFINNKINADFAVSDNQTIPLLPNETEAWEEWINSQQHYWTKESWMEIISASLLCMIASEAKEHGNLAFKNNDFECAKLLYQKSIRYTNFLAQFKLPRMKIDGIKRVDKSSFGDSAAEPVPSLSHRIEDVDVDVFEEKEEEDPPYPDRPPPPGETEMPNIVDQVWASVIDGHGRESKYLSALFISKKS